jgi:spore germination protein GerM
MTMQFGSRKARRAFQVAAGVLALGGLAWGVTSVLERLVGPEVVPAETTTTPAAPAAVAHITATLFYVTPDGQSLVTTMREVPLAEGSVAQGREILLAQLKEPPEPYVSAIPEGTTLRGFYVTDRTEAYVDLSREVASQHPGGSFTELLTVYTIVNVVTTNLPAVERVQILVDGREAETLAGHVDLRRPLQANLALVNQQQ